MVASKSTTTLNGGLLHTALVPNREKGLRQAIDVLRVQSARRNADSEKRNVFGVDCPIELLLRRRLGIKFRLHRV
jgi:hypothetical protein